MVSRTEKSIPEHRRNCSWSVLDVIVKKTCLHVDVFMLDVEDTYYLVAEYRAGGLAMLGRDCWRVSRDGVERMVSDIYAPADRTVRRKLNTPWGGRRPWLMEGAEKVAAANDWLATREGFKGMNSVRLHYIGRLEKYADPLAGVENYFSGGRGVKADPNGIRARREARQPKRASDDSAILRVGMAKPVKRTSGWSARERSVLRTLDKLIRGGPEA